MFEVIPRARGDTVGYTILSFKDIEQRSGGIVHTNIEGDSRESCAEYNRRVIEALSINRSWCASCAEMINSQMVVKDCAECINDQKKKVQNDHALGHDLVKPSWWSSKDKKIQRVLNSPAFYGQDGLSPWPIIVQKDAGDVSKKLGFSSDCPMCFGLAKDILSLIHEHGDQKARLSRVSKTSSTQLVGDVMGCRNSLLVAVEVEWERAMGWRRWRKPLSANAEVALRRLSTVDANGADLVPHSLNRCNPMFLKHQIQDQFEKYPKVNLEQTAEYPSSFRLIKGVDGQPILLVAAIS